MPWLDPENRTALCEGRKVYAGQRCFSNRLGPGGRIRGRPARSYSQPQRKWFLGRDGLFYNYRTYTSPPARFLSLAGGGIFQGFSVYRLDPATSAIRERIFAREAVWSGGAWTLKDG